MHIQFQTVRQAVRTNSGHLWTMCIREYGNTIHIFNRLATSTGIWIIGIWENESIHVHGGIFRRALLSLRIPLWTDGKNLWDLEMHSCVHWNRYRVSLFIIFFFTSIQNAVWTMDTWFSIESHSLIQNLFRVSWAENTHYAKWWTRATRSASIEMHVCPQTHRYMDTQWR